MNWGAKKGMRGWGGNAIMGLEAFVSVVFNECFYHLR